MNLLDSLYHEVDFLDKAIWSSKYVTDTLVWEWLQLFMGSYSPTGSISLPGTILDALTDVINQAGLADNYSKNFKNTGNAAILLGTQKEQVDLLVDAHLDKPTFGVAEVIHPKQAVLFACCANRFPPGEYQVNAKALRFDEQKQRVTECATGVIKSYRGNGEKDKLVFEAQDGEIYYTDLVVLDIKPQLQGNRVTGSGIDDGAGVVIVLAAACILKSFEPVLKEKSVNCLFTFSDHEEWPAESFFSQGASRTSFSLNPPTRGAIVVDVHTAGEGYLSEPGKGISCGLVSAQGKGAIIPLNYQKLTTSLISALNAREANIAQLNTGYFSRSDDYSLMRWCKMLGLLGVPAYDIHTGMEQSGFSDIRGGIIFLSHYISLVLGLSSVLSTKYSIENS